MKIKVQPHRRKMTQGVKFSMGTSANYGTSGSDVRISDNTDWSNILELFTQYRINRARVTLIPARGSGEDGIFAFTAIHDPESDETISVPASVADFIEGKSPVGFGPVNKGIQFLIPVNKEWRDLEAVQQDSSIDWALRVEDGPMSGAMVFFLLFEWDVTFR